MKTENVPIAQFHLPLLIVQRFLKSVFLVMFKENPYFQSKNLFNCIWINSTKSSRSSHWKRRKYRARREESTWTRSRWKLLFTIIRCWYRCRLFTSI